MAETPKNDGLDIAGIGKLANAIPKEVYERSAAALLTTFQKLTAPITESTAGLGRYLRQKFDTMVETEKAIATYTIEKAIRRAKIRSEQAGGFIHAPRHPKSFVRAIEEASKETDPVLHEMWTNLLASQLTDDACHPHFIAVLPHFSSAEARLLVSLLPKPEIGEHGGSYFSYQPGCFKHWIHKTGGNLNPWTLSCELLIEFRFADVLSEKQHKNYVTIFYRTPLGDTFIAAVSPTDQERQEPEQRHDP